MWAVSDDALLAGLAGGDHDAAAAFVQRFQRRVFGVAKAIVGDERSAEDVAQEAFVRAWRHADAYDPRRGSVATWLLTITRNLAIDAVRVRRPLAIDPTTIVELVLASDERGPDAVAQVNSDVERVRMALTHLPVEQRRAVLLAGLSGHSAREIAEIEGVPLGTAKTRIRTALLRLRDALVAEGTLE